jgi:RNA polymerase sigma-70 factor, ECF subfamily
MDLLSPDILRKAAAGDIDAFEQIYRAYSAFVYNVAYRMVEAREDAEEVTQEVFLTVHRKLGSFLFRSSLKTWIYRITVNSAINLLNKRNRDHKGRVDSDYALEHVAAPDVGHDNLDTEDRDQKINRLLGVLNPDERACIVLRNIQGLSYEETARALNVNLNTVRTRLKRGREKMLKMGREAIADEL